MHFTRIAYARFYSFFSTVFALSLLCLATGCNQSGSGKGEDGKIAVLVFVDRSGSIKGYSNGGELGIRKDYKHIAQQVLKPILSSQTKTDVEVRPFTQDSETAFRRSFVKWEDLRPSLYGEIDKPIFAKEEQSLTLFSHMLVDSQAFCEEHKDQDVYILVLSDGHPDEEFTTITTSAIDFHNKVKNLKGLTVASVEPDIKNQWREKLERSLAPLGDCVSVVNHTDYTEAVSKLSKERK